MPHLEQRTIVRNRLLPSLRRRIVRRRIVPAGWVVTGTGPWRRSIPVQRILTFDLSGGGR